MIQQFIHYLSALSLFDAYRAPYQMVDDSFSVDWVLPGRLAVGCLPQVSDIPVLSNTGIQAILSLCDETEGIWPLELEKNFQCHRIVLPDSRHSTHLTIQQIAIAVNHIHTCIEQSLPIFVHCLAGIERSPTICTAYLCRYHQYSLWEAMNWIKQVHPDSLPSEQQLQTIRKYLAWCDRKIA